MNNFVVTDDVESNILMAARFIQEQKHLLDKQKVDVYAIKSSKDEKTSQVKKNQLEIEIKGRERERLIQEVEHLTQLRLEKDVILLETRHQSKRYIRFLYPSQRMTLREFVDNFATIYQNGLPESMKEDPIEALFSYLHKKKVLKKDHKPYQTAIDKGYFEEKPVYIHICDRKGILRTETEAYVTASGRNRLRSQELKPFISAANSI